MVPTRRVVHRGKARGMVGQVYDIKPMLPCKHRSPTGMQAVPCNHNTVVVIRRESCRRLSRGLVPNECVWYQGIILQPGRPMSPQTEHQQICSLCSTDHSQLTPRSHCNLNSVRAAVRRSGPLASHPYPRSSNPLILQFPIPQSKRRGFKSHD